ncbi:MAG: rod shape-determining protein MreD [Acidaminococcus sp.]|jgi:rod shape-determining protein MreD|nr:rod shape-determining protein MreD [Acidaminococcus sp.]MCI2100355.1 rod shape-determining protein MreD [Acidaminococcus sp.]MCI2114676.1 rod shape-determining protein MreD [Acidaminococcus sp.]MCI2116672.1 rod shape-determining protein MreD [Acidaminococcus sp.]
MNVLAFLLLNLVLFSIQNHWFMAFTTWQSPDLLLLMLILYALKNGGKKGALYGLGIGTFLDVVTFSYFGYHIVTRTFLGAVIGKNRMNIFADRLPTYLILTAMTTLLLQVSHGLFLCVATRRWLPFFPFVGMTLRSIGWNLVCAPLVWVLYHKLQKRLQRRDTYYYHF